MFTFTNYQESNRFNNFLDFLKIYQCTVFGKWACTFHLRYLNHNCDFEMKFISIICCLWNWKDTQNIHNSYSILYVVQSIINVNTCLCFQRTKHIVYKVECIVRKQRLCYNFVEDSNIEIFLITSKKCSYFWKFWLFSP